MLNWQYISTGYVKYWIKQEWTKHLINDHFANILNVWKDFMKVLCNPCLLTELSKEL